MRKAITITVVLVSAAVLIGLALRGQRMKPKTDVASVERDIREHLSIGSSRAEVSAFLQQRKKTHSHVGQEPEAPENSNTEIALIRGASQKGTVRGDIQIIFKFDPTDSTLVRYTVREIFTGP